MCVCVCVCVCVGGGGVCVDVQGKIYERAKVYTADVCRS